ncbi:MAG: ABC transporter ATP-binding protein [Malacoplasma sp.]|nr:ABC transporter ATP-binding protein [Malacoplasma sp.]
MRKCFKYFKGKALTLLIVATILVLVSAVFTIIQPIIVQQMILCTRGMEKGATGTIDVFGIVVNAGHDSWMAYWIMLGALGGVTVLGLVSGIGCFFAAAKASLLATQNIRNATFQQILTYSFSELDKVSTSSIINRITADAQKVQLTFQFMASLLVQAIFMFVGGVVVSFILAANAGVAWMGGIVFGLVAIMLLTSILLVRKICPLFTAQQKSFDDCSAMMRQNILGVRVVKSFNLQKTQTEEYRNVNADYSNHSYKSSFWLVPLMVLVQFILNLAIVVILLAGGLVVKNGGDDETEIIKLAGDIYSIVQIIYMVLIAVVLGCVVLAITIRSLPSFARISELLSIEGSIKDSKEAVYFNEDNYDIEYKSVGFKYDKNAKEEVLKNISFSIKKGQTLGIIGATASGKSSLINLIPRLYDVTKGEVSIGGVDVRRIRLDSLRKNVKVGIQDLILFAGDIRYNIKYGNANASDKEIIEACKQACAWEFIDKMKGKLSSVVEQRGRNFSHYQRN